MKKLLVLILVALMLGACASASLSDEATVLTPGTYTQPLQVQGTQTPPMPTLDATATPIVPDLLVTSTPSVEILTTPTPVAQGTPSDLPTPTPPVDVLSSTPTPPADAPALTPTPSTPAPWATSETVVALRAKVAENFGLTAAALTPRLFEPASWPDSSLGCPKSGTEYLQALSEGWRAIFSDEVGNMYEIHATQNFTQVVFCEASQIGRLDDASAIKPNPATQAAISLLVDHLKITPEQVTVTSVESVEWANSCMGCAAPRQMCLMVITPGYRILVSHGGATYAVHTDRTGKHAILCANSTAPSSPNVQK